MVWFTVNNFLWSDSKILDLFFKVDLDYISKHLFSISLLFTNPLVSKSYLSFSSQKSIRGQKVNRCHFLKENQFSNKHETHSLDLQEWFFTCFPVTGLLKISFFYSTSMSAHPNKPFKSRSNRFHFLYSYNIRSTVDDESSLLLVEIILDQ